MSEKKQTASPFPIHETLFIGICLAFAGGFLDAYTYLLKGGVFANAQTGNLVLCAVALSKGSWSAVGSYLIPVAAFLAGVLLTEALKYKMKASRFFHWQQLILAAEILLLCLIALFPGFIPDKVCNVLISFVCSIQVNSFRLTRGLPYATTMCTGNLRSFGDHLFRYLHSHKKEEGRGAFRYLCIIFSFCTGALASGWMCTRFGALVLLLPCGVLGIVFFTLYFDKNFFSKNT